MKLVVNSSKHVEMTHKEFVDSITNTGMLRSQLMTVIRRSWYGSEHVAAANVLPKCVRNVEQKSVGRVFEFSLVLSTSYQVDETRDLISDFLSGVSCVDAYELDMSHRVIKIEVLLNQDYLGSVLKAQKDIITGITSINKELNLSLDKAKSRISELNGAERRKRVLNNGAKNERRKT